MVVQLGSSQTSKMRWDRTRVVVRMAVDHQLFDSATVRDTGFEDIGLASPSPCPYPCPSSGACWDVRATAGTSRTWPRFGGGKPAARGVCSQDPRRRCRPGRPGGWWLAAGHGGRELDAASAAPLEPLAPGCRGRGMWLRVNGVRLREQHEAFPRTSATPRRSSARRPCLTDGGSRAPVALSGCLQVILRSPS